MIDWSYSYIWRSILYNRYTSFASYLSCFCFSVSTNETPHKLMGCRNCSPFQRRRLPWKRHQQTPERANIKYCLSEIGIHGLSVHEPMSPEISIRDVKFEFWNIPFDFRKWSWAGVGRSTLIYTWHSRYSTCSCSGKWTLKFSKHQNYLLYTLFY